MSVRGRIACDICSVQAPRPRLPALPSWPSHVCAPRASIGRVRGRRRSLRATLRAHALALCMHAVRMCTCAFMRERMHTCVHACVHICMRACTPAGLWQVRAAMPRGTGPSERAGGRSGDGGGSKGGGGGDDAAVRRPAAGNAFRRVEVAVAQCTVAGRRASSVGAARPRAASAAGRRLTFAAEPPAQVRWYGWQSTRTRRADTTTRTCISSARSLSRGGCRTRRASTSRILRRGYI